MRVPLLMLRLCEKDTHFGMQKLTEPKFHCMSMGANDPQGGTI